MAQETLQSENVQSIRANIQQRQLINSLFGVLGLLVIFIAVIVLFSLTLAMAMDGAARITPEFFISFPSRKPEQAGILSAWVGTSLVMLVTACAAVPLGVASGIYLEEYAAKNWISDIIEINVTNLAGVPSIIYGLLALGLFVYQLQLGQTVLTGGLTLSLLILPVVIVTTRESIRAIPNSLREAAYGLGASKWQVIWDHILPYSFGSILTGIIIGLSRAIGQTAPLITIGALTFIAFLPDSPVKSEFPFISLAWLQAPFTVMPIQMFNWVSRPNPEFQVNAAAAGTVLTLMTLAMNSLAIYLRYRFRRGIKW
ncbi:MAG: phosphate ABC transporter permease PstA [Roseofilum sp. Belize BBD 4]|uniref:phosphate ABC transporter permease PstA n=1 Tax=Roseofilum sp. Belize BBD 4 TaxID=2821500 RepID=UPI000E999BAA|nr:phosphate ABC transporter permease PstA [Roseofilum sp. Belize BBD 4]MBP0033830.1 phosphate ABC transporter permease PstA [Roseofilum sp. Belize BBD 4]HBQ97384.1 phosphate ABC transporter permease PtsA [Cyanobacteria bacterium UBA11691]